MEHHRMAMKYQISFERLGRVHWTFCNDKQTALFVWDGLRISGNINIECLENPGKRDARWIKLEELDADLAVLLRR